MQNSIKVFIKFENDTELLDVSELNLPALEDVVNMIAKKYDEEMIKFSTLSREEQKEIISSWQEEAI